MKKVLSVVLSSCTLGVLSSSLTCQSADIGVSVNKGTQVESGPLPSSSSALSSPEQTNDGDMAVIFENDPLSALDGYILKGNVINYGENLHLVTYDSVPPLNCTLYVCAVKIKDGFGKDVPYDPNTSDTSLYSGWVEYKGRATFDNLAKTTGLWHTYAVRYKGEDFKNDYGAKYVVFDASRSTDGINRYTLLDKDRNVLVPSLLDSDNSNASASDPESTESTESEESDSNSDFEESTEESNEESDVDESESTEESSGN